MIVIDGSRGEGGGQVLRTSLALSLVTGRAVRVTHVRGGRTKPGLLRQHLTALSAAQAIGDAEVSGAELGSREITFAPRGLKHGNYTFSIGSAGSTLLVVQTLLPALLSAGGPSTLRVSGGTHNSMAPPFDHFAQVFCRAMAAMNAPVAATLVRHGFHPAGGGEVVVEISPARPSRYELVRGGEITAVRVRALVAGVRSRVGYDEVKSIAAALGLAREATQVIELAPETGPGNVVFVEIEREHSLEIVTAFGSKGVHARSVAGEAVTEARALIDADAPVGAHLADQLLLPMALGHGGVFVTTKPTLHTETQIDLIPRFLDGVSFASRPAGSLWEIEVGVGAG